MNFVDTRSNAVASGAQVIAQGLASSGGLFVPSSFPAVPRAFFERLCSLDYAARAAAVLGLYLDELKGLDAFAESAYAQFDGDPAPLIKVHDNVYFLELWHGPTHAFKDMALTVLPYLLQASKEATGETGTTLIPVATSGDTGKAALAGFKDVPRTAVAVFYPHGGVSHLQQLQMETSEGRNVFVSGISGNFDDAQAAVKAAFADPRLQADLNKYGVKLSSANSINFGRLAPQIAYYFSAYCDLLSACEIEFGEKVNFCVPSGNFGNILAGYYASRMGLPVGKLVCASNRNNVLTDFFESGTYNAVRPFYKTSSPSMDILRSSNLERLLFELCGRDPVRTAALMAQLQSNGKYSLSSAEHAALGELFFAGCAQEDDVSRTICDTFDEYGYIMDPHTAVAAFVADEYLRSSGDTRKTVVVSTASPHKFAPAVLKAIGERVCADPFKNLRHLEEVTACDAPASLIELQKKERLFTGCVTPAGIADALRAFAKQLG